jgi:hypothetical protein
MLAATNIEAPALLLILLKHHGRYSASLAVANEAALP